MEYPGFGKNSGPSSSSNPNSSPSFFRNVAPSPPNPSSSSSIRSPSPRPFVQSPASPSPAVVVKSNVLASRTSEHGGFFKFSRSQHDGSRNLNQPVPISIRGNVPPGGFRPVSIGVAPTRQYFMPRTQSPDLAYFKNSPNLEGFRPSSVGVGPVRHVARPRTVSPEMARRTNQYVDLDSSPTLAEPARHLARPRTNSPEVAFGSNQFVNLHSFPFSVGARPFDNKARPRTNSPELTPRSHQYVDLDSVSTPAGPQLVRPVVLPRTHSPGLDFKNNHPVEGFDSSGSGAPVRPAPFPYNSYVVRQRSPVSYASLHDIQDEPTASPYYDSESSKFDDVRGTNQTSSPDTLQFDEVSRFPRNNPKRPSPALRTISRVNLSTQDSHVPRRSLPHANNNVPEASGTNPSSFPSMKRSRSPPLFSGNKAVMEKSNDIQDDEREMLAKAKRLARFKVELSEKVESSTDDAEQRVSTNLPDPSVFGRSKIVTEHFADMNEDFSVELEGSKPSTVIIGLCTDMCPESERGERERKGDLDRYERLDGDRNRTSKSLAVKKYTRTAEREASLIRPMPTLKKTMEYLLNLLDQPYDDRFLGTYNFLWDRMRAIRMDLRMQHIFNQAAITMLEQMIRLHIIVMHELCEYSKGEGFSEGFDAHLNIEQMNKTSVELFQIYDDHRKNGVGFVTEKEFRGYYALLKLDKHPGYIVEPAELSLDLAKMTPEIRQTNEVLFARNVARACRTGNFIAFFRLARKASYLQACLMHAHFAKLRTQALASLHAGLQSNQGLPVVHVAKWLAMEEEDMESLLEYHGFLIKAFDEPYMVKDGPFLNGDKDYDTRCSKLVDSKKSESIVEDVRSTEFISSVKAYQSIGRKIPPTKAPEKAKMVKKIESEPKVFPSDNKKRSAHDISPVEVFSPEYVVDEDMTDYEASRSPKDGKVIQPMIEMPVPSWQLPGFNNFSSGFSFSNSLPAQSRDEGKPKFDNPFSNLSQRSQHDSSKEVPPQFVSKPIVQDSPRTPPNFIVQKPVTQALVTEVEEEDEEPPVFLEEDENEDDVEDYLDREIAQAKLKLILRSWKRRASIKRDMREQRQFAANAALNSLPLGPLVQLRREPPNTLGEFDIDNALRERNEKHEKSWSRINVSEEIAGTLSRKNPDAKCLCWKIAVCSQVNNSEETEISQSADSAVSSWLLSKLMTSSNKDEDEDLVISSSGLSIWKKWFSTEFRSDHVCCLSVVKKVNFNDTIETLAGASSLSFLLRDSIPWNLQRANLRRLLESIPSGSSLPLLILSSSFKDETSDHSSIVASELGLLDIDKSKISTFFILSLTENQQMEYPDGFFSDNQLRQGLQWLANESPSQLDLHRVKTRELILTYLSPSLEALERTNINEVNPNECVLAFNQALDRSLASIDAAAKANGNSWPCSEISSLEESSTEHRIAEIWLPDIGWNSVDRIRPLMSTLQDCKLPVFKDDLSYLSKGSNSCEEVEIRRAEFGNSLIRYLSESSKLMGSSLAVNEAGIMLQSCRLELRGSFFHIVPNWVMIFRRIFNWRLMSLSSEALSTAYVLDRADIDQLFDSRDGSRIEDDRLSYYHINQPTLDEMIEVSFRPATFGNDQPRLEANGLLQSCPNGEAKETLCSDDLMDGDSEVDRDCGHVVAGNGIEEVVAGGVNKEADRLSELLEKCNILQNVIGDKLSVYF